MKRISLLDFKKISQEPCTGSIAGPFSSPPFTNIQVSPLGIVLKKNPGEFRMIHHLSYPKGSSINDHIPDQYCSVQYQSIDHAIAAIKRIGVGALLSKSDLENAYKQVPIHPDDFELLGFLIEGSFYFDKTLPFGLSYSCQLFEKFSSALQWILESKFKVFECVHVLDDFLFIGQPNSNECYDALLSFYTLATDINLPIKSEKNSPTHHYNHVFGLGIRFCEIRSETTRRQTSEYEKQNLHFQKKALSNFTRIAITNWSLKFCMCGGTPWQNIPSKNY